MSDCIFQFAVQKIRPPVPGVSGGGGGVSLGTGVGVGVTSGVGVGVGSGDVVDVGSCVGSGEGCVGTELPDSEDAPEEAPFSEEAVFSFLFSGFLLFLLNFWRLSVTALPKFNIYAAVVLGALFVMAAVILPFCLGLAVYGRPGAKV